MEYIIWFITMIPCSMVITGIGFFAWKRKKPMWFWSGSTVDESEINDVEAYNRANGMMWISFSLVFWVSTFAVFSESDAGGSPAYCRMSPRNPGSYNYI